MNSKCAPRLDGRRNGRPVVRPRPQRGRARDVVVLYQMKVPSAAGRPALPEFERPPVAEVALGVQFRPLPQLRPLELGALREKWRPEYPIAQEQPPLPPATEGFAPGLPSVQFVIGSAPQTRLWFVREDQTGLLQLQPDRFVVNWRQASSTTPYPRYPSVRAEFEQRFDELADYLRDRSLGALEITQVEITYINAMTVEANEVGHLDHFLRLCTPSVGHHLGDPEQARIALVFQVPDIGQPPVRLYVSLDPAARPDGTLATFFTLTVRGAPHDASRESALRFMDAAHEEVVKSFAELTPDSRHDEWGRRS